MKTRVLVVDDSPVMRSLLMAVINATPDLEAIGAAPDAQVAREMVKTLNPDVLTLDVQMPKMDGLEFLERLMRLRPTPVVMVSSFTEAGSEITLRALELGAIDFIGKPRMSANAGIEEYAQELTDKIRAARSARLRRPSSAPVVPAPVVRDPVVRDPAATVPLRPPLNAATSNRIVFVGASTGGTEALKTFLLGMPADCPPILVVQHMPENFTLSFAKRLDSLCAPRVVEAQGNERLEPGTVYIAPGHSHLKIRRASTGMTTELLKSEPVNRHRPSVDVLFDSAAELVGRKAVGIILTGMGKDGAQGLLHLRRAGARTFGQDEASCVVYGMPREAAAIGAVEEVVSLDEMSRRVLNALARSMA